MAAHRRWPGADRKRRQRGEAECHNLVVADFNSYFVGRDRILVHDNNLRQVTTATVPGFVSP